MSIISKATTATILVFFMIFTFTNTGCTKKQNPESNTEKEPLIDTKKNDSQSNLLLTNNDFFGAISTFDTEHAQDARIKEAFEGKELLINQLFINNTPYVAAWVDDLGFTSILTIFKNDGKAYVPIYCKSPGEKIISVKYIGSELINKPMIEVTSYGSSGSFSCQIVSLLTLDSSTVSEVWNYQTITKDSHPYSDLNILRSSSTFSTYLLAPSYEEQDNPVILINETLEVVDTSSSDDKVIKKNKTTTQKLYIWDKNNFLEKK